MWLNMIFLSLASLCVGGILGWIIARPRRWNLVIDDTEGDEDSPAWDGSLTG